MITTEDSRGQRLNHPTEGESVEDNSTFSMSWVI